MAGTAASARRDPDPTPPAAGQTSEEAGLARPARSAAQELGPVGATNPKAARSSPRAPRRPRPLRSGAARAPGPPPSARAPPHPAQLLTPRPPRIRYAHALRVLGKHFRGQRGGGETASRVRMPALPGEEDQKLRRREEWGRG